MASNMRDSGLVEEDISTVPADELDPDAPVREPPRERQWDVILAVIVGGIVGAEGRYGLAEAMPHPKEAFPWSTIWINVLGCLFIGILMTMIAQLASPHRLVRPFLGIGALGGFTTFSTFTVDAERLIHAHRAGIGLLYVMCTLLACAAAVAAGTIITHIAGQQIVNARIRRADRAPDRLANRAMSRGRRSDA